MIKATKLLTLTLLTAVGMTTIADPAAVTAEAVMTKDQIKNLSLDQQMAEGVFDAINSFRQKGNLSRIEHSSSQITDLAQTYSSYGYDYVVSAHSNSDAYLGISAEMQAASPVKDATNYEQSFGYQIYGSTPEELGDNFIAMMFAVDAGGSWNGAHTKMMLAEQIKDIGIGVTSLGGNMYSVIVNYVENGNGSVPFGPNLMTTEEIDSSIAGQSGGGDPYKKAATAKNKKSTAKELSSAELLKQHREQRGEKEGY